MKQSSARGFTLLEMITVIVIISVISVLGLNFVGGTIDAYVATVNRGKLISKGRVSLERIARQIRGAVPNSVRVNGNCVEFMPLAGAGNYIADVPDASNLAPSSSSITTAPHVVDFGTARYLTIGAMGQGEIYSVTPSSLASLASRTSTNVTLATAKRWHRNSINRRFFLGDDPEAFCVSGGDLRYHQGYATPFNSTATPTGTGDLLADGVTAVTPFTLSSGTQDRNATLAIALVFTEGQEAIELNQEVLIRNVP